MKRVLMDSHQSYSADEEAGAKVMHQSLLQDYFKLQKAFVSSKRKLQVQKKKRDTLLAEVRFLHRKLRHLLKIQSPKLEAEQGTSHARSELPKKRKKYAVNEEEAALKTPCPVLKPHQISGGEVGEKGSKAEDIWQTLRVEEEPKNCLIGEKGVGEKKISWRDPLVLEV